MATRVGIIGSHPYMKELWSFDTFKQCLIDILDENHIRPTEFASIGMGLSTMVKVCANIFCLPFKDYTPDFHPFILRSMSILRRNEIFCSSIDHLLIFGKSDDILTSIKRIAQEKDIPIHNYLELSKSKPCNSLVL